MKLLTTIILLIVTIMASTLLKVDVDNEYGYIRHYLYLLNTNFKEYGKHQIDLTVTSPDPSENICHDIDYFDCLPMLGQFLVEDYFINPHANFSLLLSTGKSGDGKYDTYGWYHTLSDLLVGQITILVAGVFFTILFGILVANKKHDPTISTLIMLTILLIGLVICYIYIGISLSSLNRMTKYGLKYGATIYGSDYQNQRVTTDITCINNIDCFAKIMSLNKLANVDYVKIININYYEIHLELMPIILPIIIVGLILYYMADLLITKKIDN